MAVPLPQIVLFGDSLFQGAAATLDGFSFQAALQEQTIRRYDILNRGLSGYNSSQALKALPQIFAPAGPGIPKLEYLLVLLGANDAALPQQIDNQHVPISEYKDNLMKIITHPAIASHKPKILLITPPPLDEIQRKKEHDLARQAKVSASYAAMVRNIAAGAEGVVLIDLWKALMEVALAQTPGFDASGPLLGDPESGVQGHLVDLLPDGLHLSGSGYRVLWNLVMPHITPGWENMSAEQRMGLYALPEWKTAPWLT